MVSRYLVTIAVSAAFLTPSTAWADSCNELPTSGAGFVEVGITCTTDTVPTPTDKPSNGFTAYEWRPACGDPTTPNILDETCVPLFPCDDDELPSWLFGLRDGEWIPLQTACRGGTNSPTITPAAVATAFRRIPLPELKSITQPATKTLVNFDTIFYVEAETLYRSIRLLGQDVDLTITPSRFRWTFGDGTDQVTTTPGHAYPAKSVTHRYQRAHVTVEHQVEVTWTATWRVNNAPWQDVPGSVTITGLSTPLRIAEAVPLLSGRDD